MIFEALFWLLVSVVLYVYFGYPLLVLILSKLRPAPSVQKADITPMVSLIIPAYNEEKVIAQKIENCLALDYPRDKLEIIIASDGSTDGTNEIVQSYVSQTTRFFAQSKRRGKSSTLNKVVPRTHGGVLVFTDANALFRQDAVKMLVKNFADKRVGCVCGELHLASQESQTAKGEGFYWQYETYIKRKESEIYSVLFTNGAIYAIRRSLFERLDPAWADDFMIPLSIARKGYRSVQEPEAVGYEKTSTAVKDEFWRKIRIVARDSNAYFHVKGLLGKPFRPWLAFQLFSHKLLRWLVPLFMVAILGLNFLLLSREFYRWTLVAQLLFYTLAVLGWLFDRQKAHIQSRYLSIPLYYCMVNIAALLGLRRTMLGKSMETWSRAHTTR